MTMTDQIGASVRNDLARRAKAETKHDARLRLIKARQKALEASLAGDVDKADDFDWDGEDE